MLYLLIALQFLDIATTHYALRTGIGYEKNWLLRKLFDKFGHEPVLLITKGAFIGFLWYFQSYIHPAALVVLVIVYLFVVFNNIKVIREAKKARSK